MIFRKIGSIFFGFFLICVSANVYADSEIHFAYMDEEAASILRTLIAKNLNKRRVVVIERSAVKGGDRLFEKTVDYFVGNSQGAPKIIRFEDTDSKNTSHLFSRVNSHKLKKLNDTLKDSLCSDQSPSIPIFPSKFCENRPELSFIVFNSEQSIENGTVFLVRSPEMGLQPQLITRGLEVVSSFILTELVQDPVSKIKWGQWAAGGGIQHSLHPGTIVDISGSLYLGVELGTEGNREFYQYKIASSYLGKQGPNLLFAGTKQFVELDLGKSGKSKVTAKKDAHLHAYGLATEELNTFIRNTMESPQVLGEFKSRLFKDKLNSSSRISLTTSFFSGNLHKNFGRILGLNNVNMEDYHLINVINDAKGTGPVKMKRLIADPSHFPESFVERFVKWEKGDEDRYPPRGYPHLSVSGYKKAIKWGLLQNRDFGAIPEEGRWQFAEDLIHDNDENYKYFFVIPSEKAENRVLNPFFEEIAADFLSVAVTGNLLHSYMIDIEVHNKVNNNELSKNLLKFALEETNRRVQVLAKTVMDLAQKFGTTKAESEIDPKLNEILDQISYIGGDRFQVFNVQTIPSCLKSILMDDELKRELVHSLLGPEDIFLGSKKSKYVKNHFTPESKLRKQIPCLVQEMEGLQASQYMASILPKISTSNEELHRQFESHFRKIHPRLVMLGKSLKKDCSEMGCNPSSMRMNDLILATKTYYKALFKLYYPLPKIGMFVKKKEDLQNSNYDVWTRQRKWFGNFTGFVNHLPYDYLVSNKGIEFEAHEFIDRFIPEIMSKVEIQESVFDRALYKSTNGPALFHFGPSYVDDGFNNQY